MKLFLPVSLLFVTTFFFGQNTKSKDAAMFLDCVFIATNTMNYINPSEIESVHVIKNDTIINNIEYSGQIHVTSKNPSNYNFLSLEQIKGEYTTIKKNDVVYMVNGDLIKENSATLIIDRNYILTVEVTNSEEFYNLRKSDIKFDIINILGKTKENLIPKNKTLLRRQEKIGVK